MATEPKTSTGIMVNIVNSGNVNMQICTNGCLEIEKTDECLKEINFAACNMDKIPSLDLSKFQFCTRLDLSGNNLTGGLDWLLVLKRLEWIDLSRNQLSQLPDMCVSASSLRHFDISHNNFQSLPEWVLFLKNVLFLSLGYNPLQESFTLLLRKAKWNSIEVCKINNINVTVIPECLKTAPKLRELYIGNLPIINCSNRLKCKERNSLWILPKQLPASLVTLDLCSLNLANFECNWKPLVNLRELNASDNRLCWLPEDFPEALGNLKTCNLTSNTLHCLPQDIGVLRGLTRLQLAHNHIYVLPSSLQELSSLESLDLYDNYIESVDCDLTKLTKLEELDLWMNPVDPNELLPEYEQLCLRLRSHLSSHECRKSLQSEPPIATDDFASSCSPVSEINEEEPPFEHQTVAEGAAQVWEETWDTESFTDEDVSAASSIPRRLLLDAKWSPVRDEYFFRPSDMHPPSKMSSPFHFGPSVQGQFDDAD